MKALNLGIFVVFQGRLVTQAEVAKLYVATFNRAPDAGGLSYWTNSGMSIENIAQSFFDQSETQTLYPNGTANSSFFSHNDTQMVKWLCEKKLKD